MARETTIEKYLGQLWDDVETLSATKQEKDQILRYRVILTDKLDDPFCHNHDLAQKIKQKHGVSLAQAYRDIQQCEELIARIHCASKAYIRFIVKEGLLEVVRKAREKDDLKAQTDALDKLAKYNMLDKEDVKDVPYEEIVPLQPNFVNDPSILGIDCPNPQMLVAQALKKYNPDAPVTIPLENE